MRLVFAGTPDFAARSLAAIHAAGHEVSLVLTQPDRPAGRGLKLTPSAVAQLASRLALPVFKPASLKSRDCQDRIREASSDVMVVAAYGLILPVSVLTIPPRGCLNIHASILPRWRGAAPVQRAILAGDERTGVSIMAMDEGLDTGPVLLERTVEIGRRETAGELTDRLAELGAETIVAALDQVSYLKPCPQATEGATYAPKITRAEAPLDWTRSSALLDRQVRAFNPHPGAEARLEGVTLKVWKAAPAEGNGEPGLVLRLDSGCPVIACGVGALALTTIQRPGSRRLPADEYLRGNPIAIGSRFDPIQ